MTAARIYPPSEHRVAEAKRSGHVPRTALTGLAGALAGAALGTWLVAERVSEACTGLWLQVLGAAEAERAGLALGLLGELGSACAIWLASVWLLAVAFLVLGQGVALRVPLSRPRTPFPRLSAPRSAKLLAAFVLLGLGAMTLHAAMTASLHGLRGLLSQFLVQAAALLGACALVEAGLSRADYFRSLWLTRREHLDEQRQAYGAPELRAARAQRRNEARRVS